MPRNVAACFNQRATAHEYRRKRFAGDKLHEGSPQAMIARLRSSRRLSRVFASWLPNPERQSRGLFPEMLRLSKTGRLYLLNPTHHREHKMLLRKPRAVKPTR